MAPLGSGGLQGTLARYLHSVNEQVNGAHSAREERRMGGPLLSLDLPIFERKLDKHAISVKAMVHPFERPRPIADLVTV